MTLLLRYKGIVPFAASLSWRRPTSAYSSTCRYPLRRCLYNFALTRQIPNSFVNALTKYYDGSKDKDDARISLPLAKSQQEEYLSLLRSKVPTVLQLPALESHPDSIFVEDTVVFVGGNNSKARKRVVLTWPGHVSRQGEVASIHKVLGDQGMDVWDMHARNDQAICDGGDVLNTGRHVFVGLSERTNQHGAMVLEEAFACVSLPVITVPLNKEDALHLKSIVTHIDANTLLLPQGPLGDKIWRDMNAEALGYHAVRLPDIRACNVVVVNGLMVASSNICDESRTILEACAHQRNLTIAFVGTSEIHKVDGACTCCSVLLSI
jgi:dimethylargininase